MEVVLQTCVNAFVASGFFALTAVGLVLIFGVMGIVNFAHGELFMVGAYTVWFFLFEIRMAVLLGGIGCLCDCHVDRIADGEGPFPTDA